MKLVYAVSQRTDPKRPAARHLDNGEGKPMCGGNGREPLLWATEEGEPTCKICIDLAMMGNGESDKLGKIIDLNDDITMETRSSHVKVARSSSDPAIGR